MAQAYLCWLAMAGALLCGHLLTATRRKTVADRSASGHAAFTPHILIQIEISLKRKKMRAIARYGWTPIHTAAESDCTGIPLWWAF